MKTATRRLTTGPGPLVLAILMLAITAVPGCDTGGSGDDGSAAQATPAAVPAEQATTPADKPEPARTATAITNNAAQTAPTKIGSGPVLSFERMEHDFGEVVDSEKSFTSFEFTNTGTETLVISDVKASCGCTVPQLSRKTFQPGEGDTIQVTFDPKGKKGRSTKNIRVTSNSAGEPVITLQLASDVKPMLRLDSRFVRLGDLPLHQPHQSSVNVYYTDPDLEFTEITTNHPNITGQVLESGVVTSTGNDITYRATIGINLDDQVPWGSLFATRMFIDVHGRPLPDRDPIDYTYEIYLNGTLFGNLVANSTQRGRMWKTSVVTIGQLGQNSTLRTTLNISSVDGAPFEITGTRVVESPVPGIEVGVQKVTDSSYEVTISGNTGQFRGQLKGAVEIQTDFPGEESLMIHFTGRVL